MKTILLPLLVIEVFLSSKLAVAQDWHLVFRAVEGVSSPDPYDVWISHDGLNEDKPTARELTTEFQGHYKSSLVNYWNVLDITEVKVSLYKDGTALKEIEFDASSTDDDPSVGLLNWFTTSRINTSPWDDLTSPTTGLEFFSAEGDNQPTEAVKRFLIHKEYPGGTCVGYEGWMVMVTSTGSEGCAWGKAQGRATPFFMFSDGDTATQWHSDVTLTGKTATSAAIYAGGVASRAIDGNTDGNYGDGSCSQTNNVDDPWWMVDLGVTSCVSKVTIYNRVDSCCKDRLVGVQVRLGDDANRNNPECPGSPVTQAHVDAGDIIDITCNIEGRYLSVNHIKAEYLTLCEVEVQPCAPEVSLIGKTATSIGIYDGGVASRAIDGNTNGIYSDGSCSQTNNVANPWWKVDLGATICVSKVTLYNRVDSCCKNRLVGVQVRLGDDTDHTNNPQCSGSPVTQDHVDAGDVIDIICDSSGQYLSVNLVSAQYLTLCEVEVHGCISDNTFDFADIFAIFVKLDPSADQPLKLTCENDPCEVVESAGPINVIVTLVLGAPILDSDSRRRREAFEEPRNVTQTKHSRLERAAVVLTGAIVQTKKGDSDTADAFKDYGPVYFPTTEDITVPIEIVADGVEEGDETFTVELVPLTSAGTSTNIVSLTVTIKDNDGATFEFASAMYIARESNTNHDIMVTIARRGLLTEEATVRIRTVAESAKDGDDYISLTDATVTFQPDNQVEDLQEYPVTIVADDIKEGFESFRVELVDVEGGGFLGKQTVTMVFIDDDDGETTYYLDKYLYSVQESVSEVSVTVYRDGDKTQEGSVVLYISNVNEGPSSDDTSHSFEFDFQPGEPLQTKVIPIPDENIDGSIESFEIGLRNPVNGVLGSPSSTVLLVQREVTYYLDKYMYRVQESDEKVSVKVYRDGDTREGRVVLYTSDGSAVSPSDYRSASFDIVFEPGESMQTRDIPITKNNVVESMESFEIALKNPVNGMLGTLSSATALIEDDDVMYSMGSNFYITSENEGKVRVTVTRSGFLGKASSVGIQTQDGSASSSLPNVDYGALSTNIGFDVDDPISYIDIDIINDNIPENTEHFRVELESNIFAIGEPASATVEIRDTATVKRIASRITLAEIDGSPATYNPEYGNPNSAAYRDLAEKVLIVLGTVLGTFPGFLYSEILAILPGSVTVEFTAVFDATSPVTYEDIVQKIAADTSSDGFLGGSSLKVFSSDDGALSDGGLAGVIIASAIVILIIMLVIVAFLILLRKKGKLPNAQMRPVTFHTKPVVVTDGATIQVPYSHHDDLAFTY